ncbi:adenosinetriphosphatase [Exophiala viscosa]|uniref:DNA helicase n=1 Tax=Exophiala viscosa TaxID=2486360 RepID=A0AAN6IC65_9EURO|nr:adenosinetriphosphatase [Exophiala viscosa]
MPNSPPTGDSHSNHQDQEIPKDKPALATPPRQPSIERDDHDGPPAKRRKITDTNQRPSPRLISPPWKRVVAEGPTTFVENGRRKSGRTNVVPLELQPQSTKRNTRAAFDKVKAEREKVAKPVYNVTAKKAKVEIQEPTSSTKRGPGRPPKSRDADSPHSAKQEETPKHTRTSTRPKSTQVKTKSPRRSAGPVTRRDRPNSPHLNGVKQEEEPYTNGVLQPEETDNEGDDSDISSLHEKRSPSPPLLLSKVIFRVRLPQPSVATPANIPAPKKFGSFTEFLERDDTEPREDTVAPVQITREAVARRRVREAQRRGRLTEKKLLDTLPDRPEEPKRQYAHLDHLLAHVSRFKVLLKKEAQDHRRQAHALAHEAKKYVEDKQKRNRVKTVEEIEREKRDATIAFYRTVVKDVDKLWAAVRAEVDAMRQKQYEEEQQARVKGHLARVLDRTDQMLNKAAEHEESIVGTDAENSTSETSEEDSEDSEQMSETDTDSESEPEVGNGDAEMSVEELRRKYENLPDMPEADEEARQDSIEASENETDPKQSEEDSDPETEMDSEFDTDESGTENEDDDDEHEGEEEAQGGLLSLFSKKEISEMAPASDGLSAEQEEAAKGSPLVQVLEDHEIQDAESLVLPASPDKHGPKEVDAESRQEDIQHSASGEDSGSADPSAHTSPPTSATKVSESDSVSSIEPHAETALPLTPFDGKSSTIKTPVPSLLRGTLRPYQHEGLDWLAELYAHGRSGILADEMGLGKTIQSISVLAHLAEVHEVWGPHLIVVPTSVMLNWEMEFKKFLPGFKILTYYGNQEERKQKRRGWMADDSFNVCITSYQLVLQDANSFKRRRWHYMILDEAHNIKNFRSERWQTMMTFNTRARLLLTGTPLQNNLTELWSLLFFLHYGQDNEGEDDAFAGLKEWSEWFKKPVESILEHGRQVLDEEDKEQVAKLHKVIRPFLLRRLKADVEKQMPLKYEHVEMCRLSKRQRQLYDGFMSRAQTKETMASGNYLSIINALMQLRKVCNHPDLFETRPITTSFAMPKSVAADFEINDFLVRRKLMLDASSDLNLDFLQLAPISHENMSMIEFKETVKRHAYQQLKGLMDSQRRRIARNSGWNGETRAGVLGSLENIGRKARIQELDQTMYYESWRHNQRPIYGRGLLEKLAIKTTSAQLSRLSPSKVMSRWWEKQSPVESISLVHSVESRSKQMEPFVQQFACITPAVVATDLGVTTVTVAGAAAIRGTELARRADPFHQARMKMSIAFPDKRLLQYDCGKLQRLDKLLRQLQAGGHRALIFTQMTKVLDILEQFLNIHGHRYLRLDGATKIEQRQILTDRFNNDTRILAFILSSRSGGLGINLTGADTVIFYDMDWNPAMDKQCTDRAHRIGQTRDVHIYRFVSEHTIESNILRKASQKQMLDDVVIQEGDFTTDYMNKLTYRDMLDDNTAEDDVAGQAMDRLLGNDRTNLTVLETAEDQEDRAAAKVAAREVQHADDGDFEDKTATATPRTNDAQTPGPFAANETALAEAQANDEAAHDIDEYMIRVQTYLMRDVPLGPGKDKRKKGKRRDEHRVRRAR